MRLFLFCFIELEKGRGIANLGEKGDEGMHLGRKKICLYTSLHPSAKEYRVNNATRNRCQFILTISARSVGRRDTLPGGLGIK